MRGLCEAHATLVDTNSDRHYKSPSTHQRCHVHVQPNDVLLAIDIALIQHAQVVADEVRSDRRRWALVFGGLCEETQSTYVHIAEIAILHVGDQTTQIRHKELRRVYVRVAQVAATEACTV